MSERSRKEALQTPPGNDNLPAKYDVGYGKPPVEHRFQKGRSGNPQGRPKGAKNRPVVDLGHGMKPAAEFLKMEAYRPVTIREGDKLIELPAIQAVFRAMGVSAMKGNRFAQRTLAELISSVEHQEHQRQFELFGDAVEYKHNWDQEIERCRKLGLPIPEPIPHPDDIILDPNTGDVRFHGPKTKEQKAHYDEARVRREMSQKEVSEFAERHRRARDPRKKQMWLEEWHYEQRLFDIINDSMPARYKMKLQDRSYHPDASREGKTLQPFLQERKRSKTKRELDG